MKRLIFLLILVIALPVFADESQKADESNLSNSPSEEFDFRNAKWGWDINRVKASEKAKLVAEKTNSLGYSDTVANYKVVVLFTFIENQLTNGAYSFMIDHSNNNLYLDDYANIQNLLIKKYGSPLINNKIWSANTFKDDPSHHGMAVAAGHYKLTTVWNLPNTEIALQLFGDNYEISLLMFYRSKKHEELMQKSNEEEKLKGL